MKPRSMIALTISVLLVGSIAAVMLIAGGSTPKATSSDPLTFRTVKRTDLVAIDSFTGTVGSREGPQVVNRLSGTLTELPADGSGIVRGEALYSVNGEPVVLLYGDVPAWRDLGFAEEQTQAAAPAGGASGTGQQPAPAPTPVLKAPPPGRDIRQLEENLDALGYDPGAVDETFTSSTQAAIERWQSAIGMTADGVVELGRVVFLRGRISVDRDAEVGSTVRDGDKVISTSLTSEKIVTVELSDDQDLALGDKVAVVVAGGKRITAGVTSVDESGSAAAGPGAQEETTSTATVEPKNENAFAGLRDGSSVDVEVVLDKRSDVLVVPVTALLARASGGYVVEVKRGSGTELVGVDPGLYADENVEIEGKLRAGDQVVVP